jgi:DNA-binding response OmpR family regulator
LPKLLVADDSTTIQRVVELTFASEDIEVVAVGDGDQAIARIPIEHPDIVLADIAMPKRDGYQVSAFVKSHHELAHVPVLLLAGAFEPVDETRARDARSDGVIVKPFDPRQMVTRVRELLNAATARAAVSAAHGAAADQRALDDYFERLDHDLHTRATTKPDSPVPIAPPDLVETPITTEVPTVESVLDSAPIEGAMQSSRDVIPQDLVDEIAGRVLERLSRGTLKETVSAVVREVLEQHSPNQAHNSQLPTSNSQNS